MGFILLRWGTIGAPGHGDPNLYAFLRSSPFGGVDPYGLSFWSKCKDFCKDLFGAGKDVAKDKAKEKIKDKLKEWFADHVGGESAEQAKKDCDSLSKCSDQSPSDARWGGNCITCAAYKCAISASTPEAANNCLKAKLIGCLSGIAP